MVSQRLSFASLNLWHGLSSDSKLRFSYLEPKTRRNIRQELQFSQLKALQADVYFLQEVNPVWERSLEFAEKLNKVAFEQPDLAGVKLFGLGFPLNLNSGLLTLAPEKWSPRCIEALMLSGHKGAKASTLYSFQLEECRYALMVEAIHPVLGKLLLVNTHLHHGLEWKESYRPEAEAWVKKYDVSASVSEELYKRLKAANSRRSYEINRLLARLSSLRSTYQFIVLAGDLNVSPESDDFQDFLDFGFHPQSQSLKTWNPQENQASHHFQAQFPPTVMVEDLTFSPTAQQELVSLIRKWEAEPRQLDYVLVSGPSLVDQSLNLFGYPTHDQLALSDHLGIHLTGEFNLSPAS